MTGSRPRIVILLPWTLDPEEWTKKFARGEARDPSPYGYGAAAMEFDLEWCRSVPETRLRRRFRKRIARQLGFDLLHAWSNRKALFAADVVWTHTEREHLAVAFLQRIRLRSRRTRVVAQSVWLWDAWSNYSKVHKLLVAFLLRSHSIELVHSNINCHESRRLVPGRLVEQVPFGTSVPGSTTRSSTPAEPQLVVAAGNDQDRDWKLLSEVAALFPEAHFRIATRSSNAQSIQWPANVTVAEAQTILELDGLYQSASAIVIPTQPNGHASGATSLIEALAAGSATIVSSCGGLDDYAADDALLIRSGDLQAFEEAVRLALRGGIRLPTKDGYIRRGLTQTDYVQRYMLVTKWILGQISYPDHAFRFEPVSQR